MDSITPSSATVFFVVYGAVLARRGDFWQDRPSYLIRERDVSQEVEGLKYHINTLEQQTALLEQALNEVRAKAGLPMIQMRKKVRGIGD